MSVESWTLDALVDAYKQHLRATRELREQTLVDYQRLVRRFPRAAMVLAWSAKQGGRKVPHAPCKFVAAGLGVGRFQRSAGRANERIRAGANVRRGAKPGPADGIDRPWSRLGSRHGDGGETVGCRVILRV